MTIREMEGPVRLLFLLGTLDIRNDTSTAEIIDTDEYKDWSQMQYFFFKMKSFGNLTKENPVGIKGKDCHSS